MATINLGSIKFNWKGAYNGATAYAVDDVVSSGGSSYVCILASTGNATSNGTYWELMSSAGTNGSDGSDGTDLSTTLSTQGDILYRDGSGLQRLAKGTAGQVLKMNSGATAPEYGDAGGGAFTFLTSTTVSSAVSSITFENFVNSSLYDTYMMDFSFVNGQSGGGYLYFQQYAGSWQTSGYKIHTTRLKENSASYGAVQGDNESGWIVGTNLQESGGYGASGRIYFNNFTSSSAYTTATWNCFAREQSGNWTSFMGGGATSSTGAGSKLLVRDTAGDLDSGTFALYGIKKS